MFGGHISTRGSFIFINVPQTSFITMGFAFIKNFIKHFSSVVKKFIHRWKRLIIIYLLSERIILLKERTMFKFKKPNFLKQISLFSIKHINFVFMSIKDIIIFHVTLNLSYMLNNKITQEFNPLFIS